MDMWKSLSWILLLQFKSHLIFPDRPSHLFPFFFISLVLFFYLVNINRQSVDLVIKSHSLNINDSQYLFIFIDFVFDFWFLIFFFLILFFWMMFFFSRHVFFLMEFFLFSSFRMHVQIWVHIERSWEVLCLNYSPIRSSHSAFFIGKIQFSSESTNQVSLQRKKSTNQGPFIISKRKEKKKKVFVCLLMFGWLVIVVYSPTTI